MVQAIHDHDEGRLADEDFEATADDAVRLAIAAQEEAGCDVVSDGEQRRDSYANFVGSRLDNVKRIPLVDLLPLVDEPEKLRAQFDALDVPASVVRHPALFGKLSRRRPLAAHELAFARSTTQRPIKVALPGPYLLTRILWMECLVDRPYETREDLGEDIVRVLREEIHFLLAGGAALVQLDEPVLTEVVFGAPPSKGPVFMCGALSEKKEIPEELAFARDLLTATLAGLPRERMALHVCRGNWTPDESAALRGDYRPLLPTLSSLSLGTVFLELCTPRAGEMEVLRELSSDVRVGVGVVNPKRPDVESIEEIRAKAMEAVRIFGRERVLLNPDCGFATFADNPVASAHVAQAKMRAIAAARDQVRTGA
jgi:5-methyltetrahydropteroyltriglutamate--homocysteine methyltransferase